MTIDKRDFEKLLNKLEPQKQDEVIRRSLDESAFYMAGWIKSNRLSGPRPQFLGVVTERLRASVATAPTVRAGDVYVAKIGTNVEYGRIHEYGGLTGRNHATKIRPRPFMRPAIEDRNNQALVLEDLRTNLEAALEK